MDGETTFANGYALIIGVGKDLPMTVNDAQGIYNILTDVGRAAYPKDNVILLTEVDDDEIEDATKQNILDSLNELASKVSENDDATVFIYFSGHGGQPNGEIEDYYLLPFDFDKENPTETGISANLFTEKINQINPNKLVVFLDCCHAGGMVYRKSIEDTAFQNYLKNDFIEKSPTDLFETLDSGSGRAIISSSSDDEYSIARKETYSIFTEVLIEALAGENSDENDGGYANILDVTQYLLREVPKRTKRTYAPFTSQQHPIITELRGDEDFNLCYYAGGNLVTKGIPSASNLNYTGRAIFGTVFEKGTNKTVTDAFIKIENVDINISKRTSEFGDFRFDNVPYTPEQIRIIIRDVYDKQIDFDENGKYVIDLGKTVKGTIFDKNTNKAVSGATIIFNDYDLQGRANENGFFEFKNVPNDAINFRVNEDLNSEIFTINENNENKTYNIDVPADDPTIWEWLIKKLFEDEFWQKAIVSFCFLVILLITAFGFRDSIDESQSLQFLIVSMIGLSSALTLFFLVPPKENNNENNHNYIEFIDIGRISIATAGGLMLAIIAAFYFYNTSTEQIEGKVIRSNGEAINKAKVTLQKSKRTKPTNSYGKFRFREVIKGEKQIKIFVSKDTPEVIQDLNSSETYIIPYNNKEKVKYDKKSLTLDNWTEVENGDQYNYCEKKCASNERCEDKSNIQVFSLTLPKIEYDHQFKTFFLNAGLNSVSDINLIYHSLHSKDNTLDATHENKGNFKNALRRFFPEATHENIRFLFCISNTKDKIKKNVLFAETWREK